MRGSTSLVLVILLVLVAGCSSGDGASPGPSEAPYSVASTTVMPSASVSPSVDEVQLRMQEAERVLRRSFELEDYPLVSGDFSQYPPELEELLMGDYLTASKASFETAKQAGWRGSPDTVAQVSVIPKPGLFYQDSTAALLACTDTRDAPMLDSSGAVVSEGTVWVMNYYFKPDQGKLKIFTARNKQEVPRCPTE